jgi:predicted dehydrogenase
MFDEEKIKMEKKIKGNSVKWGIIGVGNVCEVKSAPAMNKIPNSEITAVMRRDIVKCADFAKRHGVPKWYNDVDQLINDPEVNAIYIATLPNVHRELAIKVAKAGKPAYVEKPMARTYKECQDMVDVFSQKKLPLYVAYYRRALPNFLKVKSLIESGEIGKVRIVQVQMIKPVEPDVITFLDDNWRVDPEVSGGGYFFDLASHQLDYLDFLFGPIQEAKGISLNQVGKYQADDMTIASFSFKNNIVGSGTWCFTASNSIAAESITIIGSKGHISFSTFGDPAVTFVSDDATKQVFDFEMPAHIQQPMIAQVVADLLGNGVCVSTGESAARTNLILETIVA